VFGPRQRHDSAYAAVIPRFIESLRSGTRPVIFGDGRQTRDFTHVDNAVHANLLAGACERELRGETINIACGERFSLLDVLAALREIMRVQLNPEFAPPRAGDVQHSLADIAAARNLIGYAPVVGFREGLQRMLAVR
jgi:nucleoside-diphosphate-sugar epimerase